MGWVVGPGNNYVGQIALYSDSYLCLDMLLKILWVITMVKQVTIRFYAELNDFLPPGKRKQRFSYKIKNSTSIKDLVEAIGVPHTEIDLILVNGCSVNFDYQVQGGEQISVYPVFESLDISPVIHLRPEPLRKTRFVLDTHLGRLAAYLRMLGFDSLYRNDSADQTLAMIAAEQQRILLTCDRQLLMRKIVTRGYLVRSRQPKQQLLEVLTRFELFNNLQPFTRCMHCNALLETVDKQLILTHLLPRTRKYYDHFWQCPDCQRIYWKGSHYQRMQSLIDEVKQTRDTGPL
jgi:hypothetical protein